MPISEPLRKSFDRLFRHTAKSQTGCIEWTGSINTDGYGQIWCGQKVLRTHRVSFELCVGPIPPSLHVLHRCDNRPCINPAHLFLGTNAENVEDKVAKGRRGRVGFPVRARRKRRAELV
jgi:hypothetical protein